MTTQQLEQYLEAANQPRVTLWFADVERQLGQPLPDGARLYHAWCAGSLDEPAQLALANWAIESVYPRAEIVTFRRRT
jgi:hypothetical protein